MASGSRPGSVIIPAHNEARVIGRLLAALSTPDEESPLEIVVVCNGCTDDTVHVARQFPGVQVVETEVASKLFALRLGDQSSSVFPRAYVDADVEISRSGVTALFDVLAARDLLAAGPTRALDLSRSSWVVRAYYSIWESLPAVDNLQGRGVIAVSAEGHGRLLPWPEQSADDLFVASRFGPRERQIVWEAVVSVHAPRTVADLVRRRIRTAAGNRDLAEWSDGETSSSRRSTHHLLRTYLTRPARWPDVAAFASVTAFARIASRVGRRRVAGVWLRDESSRT